MELIKTFQIFLERHRITAGMPVLVAVSGGVDSVVLCDLCIRSGLDCTLVHCHFGLRGTESDRDEAFVRSMGKKYERPVLVQRFDTTAYAEQHGISIQEAARALRYQWFEQLEKNGPYSGILLAHHADDTIETVLMHFFRGTGLKGLTGIPEFNHSGAHLYRPLLDQRKSAIIAYARENELDWVEDSSNQVSKYTRNYFRNELIPAVRAVFPHVEENILNNAQRFRGVEALYEIMLQGFREKFIERKGNETRIPVRKLLPYQHTSLVFELIREFGFGEKQVEEVRKLLQSTSGKYITNQHWQIIRHRNWLVIAPVSVDAETLTIEPDTESIQFSGGILTIRERQGSQLNTKAPASMVQLDQGELEFPLLLRKWKTGDYFYPLGLRKKKKIARFLIDQKLSRNKKENIWVLESGKKIAWVLGMRMDDRFRVKPSTRSFIEITWKDQAV